MCFLFVYWRTLCYNASMSNYVLNEDWQKVLTPAFTQEFKQKLFGFVNEQYATHRCFPTKENVFHALNLTPVDKVKVVIIGQDPYHTPLQADGLAFSCADGKAQPSLQNIFKELSADLGVPAPTKTTLYGWAEQGVLLLNSVLTVQMGVAGSHAGHGWEEVTKTIIKYLASLDRPIVFILWGGYARKYASFIDKNKHLVIESAHPSPLSAYNGFFGSKPFSCCNDYLVKNGLSPIKWENN